MISKEDFVKKLYIKTLGLHSQEVVHLVDLLFDEMFDKAEPEPVVDEPTTFPVDRALAFLSGATFTRGHNTGDYTNYKNALRTIRDRIDLFRSDEKDHTRSRRNLQAEVGKLTREIEVLKAQATAAPLSGAASAMVDDALELQKETIATLRTENKEHTQTWKDIQAERSRQETLLAEIRNLSGAKLGDSITDRVRMLADRSARYDPRDASELATHKEVLASIRDASGAEPGESLVGVVRRLGAKVEFQAERSRYETLLAEIRTALARHHDDSQLVPDINKLKESLAWEKSERVKKADLITNLSRAMDYCGRSSEWPEALRRAVTEMEKRASSRKPPVNR